jgi:hypothetical protein
VVCDNPSLNLRAGLICATPQARWLIGKNIERVTEAVALANQGAAHCAIEQLLATLDPI